MRRESGEAEALLRIILEENTGNIEARQRLADVLVLQGRKDEAREEFRTLAAQWRLAGELASARTVLDRLLRLDPEDTAAFQEIKEICAELGDDESLVALHLGTLRQLRSKGKHDEAIKQGEEALAIRNNHPGLLMEMVDLYGATGNRER